MQLKMESIELGWSSCHLQLFKYVDGPGKKMWERAVRALWILLPSLTLAMGCLAAWSVPTLSPRSQRLMRSPGTELTYVCKHCLGPCFSPHKPFLQWKLYAIANILENRIDADMILVSYLVGFITPSMVFPRALNPFLWSAKIAVLRTRRSQTLWVKVKLSSQAASVNIKHTPLCHWADSGPPPGPPRPPPSPGAEPACRPHHRWHTNSRLGSPDVMHPRGQPRVSSRPRCPLPGWPRSSWSLIFSSNFTGRSLPPPDRTALWGCYAYSQKPSWSLIQTRHLSKCMSQVFKRFAFPIKIMPLLLKLSPYDVCKKFISELCLLLWAKIIRKSHWLQKLQTKWTFKQLMT